MSNLVELKRISIEFRRLSSNLLCSGDDNVDSNLYRFKEYIDKTEIISNIISEKIKNVEIIFSECFQIESNDWCEVNIPKEENKHLKAIYDLIEYITSNEISVRNVAFGYYCSSRKIKDIIQNFLNISIKPLIDYIIDEISKKMIIEEGYIMAGVNINGADNSTISIAYGGSTQNVTSNINSNNEIIKTIYSIKEELKKSEINEEEKESIEDDLDVIKEQVQNSVEKPTRLKKAYFNLISFLEKSARVVTKASNLGIGIQKLIDLLSKIIK